MGDFAGKNSVFDVCFTDELTSNLDGPLVAGLYPQHHCTLHGFCPNYCDPSRGDEVFLVREN